MKPGTAPLRSVRLMDQVRERIRYLHYSLSTEKFYLYWIRFFIRWQAKGETMRHPRDMGVVEVEAFLTHLATDRKVSASTHNQALSALLFLCREVSLLARLLYGTGMRLMEGLRLRIKDVDFDRHVIIVREAKGNKDRVAWQICPRHNPAV